MMQYFWMFCAGVLAFTKGRGMIRWIVSAYFFSFFAPAILMFLPTKLEKYITIRQTNVLRKNPSKKDVFGDIGTDVVKTIPEGTIIEISKKGAGGRGIVATPYLIFENGDYIIAYDAKPANETTLPNQNPTQRAKIKIKDALSNPFKQGFNKYVVIQDFIGRKFGGDETREYKKGMNVYAKFVEHSGSPYTKPGEISTMDIRNTLVSYAGFVMDSSKVSEKNKNLFEKVQSFFSK
jgi:hypothetical protein